MEARRESPTTVCQLQDAVSLTDSSRRITKGGKDHQLPAPAGQDGYLISYGLCSTKSPPTFFLLAGKIMFLSFVCWACLWFYCSLLVPNCSSLLFLNQPIFAGKITDFWFKVNSLFPMRIESHNFKVFALGHNVVCSTTFPSQQRSREAGGQNTS